MTRDEADPTLALMALLDEEHKAIRRGDFSGLAEFARGKALLLDRLSKCPAPDGALLEQLRQLARRNSTDLAAAARGLRAAQRRIKELTEPGAMLQMYDAAGQPITAPARGQKLERRA